MSAESAKDYVIEIEALEVQFDSYAALRGVNLKVSAGRIVALIGPNGSGKTTLLRCLLGLQKPSSGVIRLFGKPFSREQLPRMGYVPQRIHLDASFMLSVREFLSLRLTETRHWFWRQSPVLDELLEKEFFELKVTELLDRPVAKLSGGQLQRVLIAFSLLRKPELLLLDEPTAGVDTTGEQTFYELIDKVHERRAMTVVLVSHDLSMVYRHASWVYALNGVVCCEGKPEEVMNAESLKEAYGIHVTPYHHHHHHHNHNHNHPHVH